MLRRNSREKRQQKSLLCDLWEGDIRRSQVFSVWPVCSCYMWKLQWREWGFRAESHLQPLCKEESNQYSARRCKIRSGTTSSKNLFFSPTRDFQQLILGQKRCGQGAWLWSRTSSPQKCPRSRRWCQIFWALSVRHQGRLTLAALCSQWIHNCWQQLHGGTWCALQFTLQSASLITSGSKQGFVSCHCKRYCTDKKCKCLPKNMKCNSKCHSNSSCKNKLALSLFITFMRQNFLLNFSTPYI